MTAPLLDFRPDGTDWMADGLCRQIPEADPLFFPEKGRGLNLAEAVRLCEMCPVREACLAYALARREQYGVWGGTTPNQRRRIWRKRAAETAKKES